LDIVNLSHGMQNKYFGVPFLNTHAEVMWVCQHFTTLYKISSLTKVMKWFFYGSDSQTGKLCVSLGYISRRYSTYTTHSRLESSAAPLWLLQISKLF